MSSVNESMVGGAVSTVYALTYNLNAIVAIASRNA